MEETSWLGAPFEQWLIETPADLARKAGLLIEDALAAPVNEPDRRNETGAKAMAPMKPALPLLPEEYTPADMRMDCGGRGRGLSGAG